MKKSIIIAIFVHVFILSLVWVGFAVPLPKDKVQFSYSGAFLLAGDESRTTEGDLPKRILNKAVAVKTKDGALFAPWVKMRELDKPRE